MELINYFPDTKKIITITEAMVKTQKEYQILKKFSQTISKTFEEELKYPINQSIFSIYYLQTIFQKPQYKSLSNIEKEIIIANVFLPDDDKIAELLNNNGFTIEHIKAIMRFRMILKNTISNDIIIDNDLKNNFKIYKNVITQLIELFKIKFNFDNQTIILNRLCEMLVTCPNYFDSKHMNNNSKKR